MHSAKNVFGEILGRVFRQQAANRRAEQSEIACGRLQSSIARCGCLRVCWRNHLRDELADDVVEVGEAGDRVDARHRWTANCLLKNVDLITPNLHSF